MSYYHFNYRRLVDVFRLVTHIGMITHWKFINLCTDRQTKSECGANADVYRVRFKARL